jgi:uncharacterized protein (DUF488 family)
MGIIMNQAPNQEQSISGARLMSIGHSNHTVSALIELLRAASVTAVADVRSRPYSGRNPQFNRPELESALNELDMHYAFLGDSLGGRPSQMSLYDEEGRVDYERVRKTAGFQRGLQRLIDASEEHRIAMLCAEEDPLDCHRGLMITPALIGRGIAALHLRGNGEVETNEQMEQRLCAETGVGVGILDGLFAATLSGEERRALIAEAYRVMAKRKAYRLRTDEETVE